MGTEKEKACRDCTLRRLQNLLRRFCERSIQKSEFSIQNCNTLTGNVFKYSDSCILTSLLQTPRRGEVGDRERECVGVGVCGERERKAEN